jgi:phage FluMu protein Com
MRKCTIPNKIVEFEKLQPGDEMIFFMPGFCTGDYSFKVKADKKTNKLILGNGAPANVFDGCNGYVVRRNGLNYSRGETARYDYRYTCNKCGKLYIVNRVMSTKSEPCPDCKTINKKVEFFTPLDYIYWERKYKKQIN